MTKNERVLLTELTSLLTQVASACSRLMETIEKEEWISISRASEETGLTERQIRYKVQSNELRSRKDGGKVLVLAEDLDRYISRHECRKSGAAL